MSVVHVVVRVERWVVGLGWAGPVAARPETSWWAVSCGSTCRDCCPYVNASWPPTCKDT